MGSKGAEASSSQLLDGIDYTCITVWNDDLQKFEKNGTPEDNYKH
jgi:hypothetical protein